MPRSDPNGLESQCQHEQSPGLIVDDELVCRGGYDPMHYNKGKPKQSIIRAAELLAGSLSVWRGGHGKMSDFIAAVDKIRHGPPNQVLKQVFAPPAETIRDIAIEGADRVFYVVDDCRTDVNGGFDILHAGVQLAPELGVTTTEDDLFLLAKAQLYRVLTNHIRDVPAAA
ncbi:MAG: hypothetical protein ACOH2T_27990 [Pseudomonas sp.]